jgi:hypothetical protein
MLNRVLESAAAQHMKTYIERKLLISNYRRRIWLSRHIFVRMVNFLAKFERSSPACLGLDFYYR